MFGLQTLTHLFQQQPQSLSRRDWVTVGDVVLNLTTGRAGEVVAIAPSPYYGEAEHGIYRAFVVGNGWTDWWLAGEVAFPEIENTIV